MKRILFVVLVFGLFSCGTKDEFKVSYLQIWADSLNINFENICKDWAEREGINIVLEPVALKDLDLKIATMIESKSGPDLAVCPSHQVMIYKNNLAKFNDVANELTSQYGNFYPVPLKMNTFEDDWYGIPIYSWSHIAVYRKDLLEKLNINVPKTYEELTAYCEKFKKEIKNVFPIGIGLGKDDDAAMFFQSVLWAFGGKVVAEDGKTIIINSDETKNAINYILNLYQKGYMPAGVLGWDGASNNKNFIAGELGLTFNSPTIYYAAKRENPELYNNITHSLYPIGQFGQFSYATGFSLISLNDNDKIDLVKSLVGFIFSKENYSKLISSGEGSVNPSITGFENLKIWEDPNLQVALESINIEQAVGYPGPVTQEAAATFQRRILTDIFGRIINDKLSVDEALNEAESRIREIYGQTK